MPRDHVRIGEHALRAMIEDAIPDDAILHVPNFGELIGDYLDDARGHSYLMLGYWEKEPIHVCAADKEDFTFVITAYRPDPRRGEEPMAKTVNKTICPTCGRGDLEPRLVEVFHTYEGTGVLVKNVPADVCPECGEK